MAGRLARRIGLRDGPEQRETGSAGLRREDAGDARIPLGDGDRGGGVTLRRDDLERSRRAGAEGLLQLRIADARALAVRQDLDRRHAGLQPEDGQREHDEHERRGRPEHPCLAPEALGPARRQRRAVRGRAAPAQRQCVDPMSQPRQHGGQERQRRGEHEGDAEHDPERRRPERRDWARAGRRTTTPGPSSPRTAPPAPPCPSSPRPRRAPRTARATPGSGGR